jgi:hypothetical protein
LREGTSENEGRGAALKANVLNRFIAKFIDLLVVMALSQVLPPVGYLAALTYLLIKDGFSGGRSIGKRLIGLHVIIRERSAPCTFRESVIRNFPLAVAFLLAFIPLAGKILLLAILGLEALLVIGNEQGFRIGDELARTRVEDGEFQGLL